MYLTRAEVRAIDRRAIEEFGIPGVVLMENAGRSAAELLMSLGVHGPVAICCGKGNNGGDGFVIARHLDVHNIAVKIHLFARPEELTGEAAINCRIVQNLGLPFRLHEVLDKPAFQAEFSSADWIVDALFGTGLSGPLRPPFDEIVAAINDSGSKILAVDIPSGLDCDTGEPLGPTVRATHTVTFVALKKGFANPNSLKWTGEVHVAGIGVKN